MSLDDAKPHVVDASPYEVFVRSARAEPCMQDLVKKNYLDESVYEASARYARSSEFSRAVSLLQPYVGRDFRVLDLGAGRGLTSLALAEQGVRVTAVEYDDSEVIGAGALARLERGPEARLEALRADGLQLPFKDGTFDAAFCRSVLHHLGDLPSGLREVLRVLKPGGLFLACGEHIRSPFGGGRRFLSAHPAVAYGVDERAYPTLTYRRLLRRAGFHGIRLFGYPLEFDDFRAVIRENPIRARLTSMPLFGGALARVLHAAHVVVRRYVLVPEASLPAISLVASKPRLERGLA